MNPFLGEIRPVPFNFAPVGWAMCNGQILPINQYQALFSLLGTFYGGNGVNNFALPNLQGRVALGTGQGLGLSVYDLGQAGGVSSVTLDDTQLPAHGHAMDAVSAHASEHSPAGNVPGISAREVYAETSLGALALPAVQTVGESFAHNNLQPYLTINYIIALEGVYPTRG